MNVFRSFAEIRRYGTISALALGFFDGIHRGHQRVIAEAICPPFGRNGCVLTFRTHPQRVVSPDTAPALLTGLAHKLHDLGQFGVNNVLALPFNLQIMQVSAAQFLQDLAENFPDLKRISVGRNWRFGHGRVGDVSLLQQWGAARQLEVLAHDFVEFKGAPINSSRIRACVTSGDLDQASQMLGKPYSLFGLVVQGRQLGHKIGVPTINLKTQDECLPPFGVYFGNVQLGYRETFSAAINIGLKPSINQQGSTPSVEAHLLHFDRDVYGEQVSIQPQVFHRPEQKFASLLDLQAQLQQDLAAARQFHEQQSNR